MIRKTRITDLLHSGSILVGDGAWGTFLQELGLSAGECPELWNVTHPEQVLQIARSYVEAGADIIETNSFGGSSVRLAHYGLSERAYELNRAAAAISRRAAGEKVIVMGSIGPTGKLLLAGDVSAEELYESFKGQAVALEDGGADAVIVETMSDPEEALIAVKAAYENTSCEVVCSFTFERTASGEYRTMMGFSPAEVVRIIRDSGISVLGTNCGNGIEDMIPVVNELSAAWPEIPLIVQANAGLPVINQGKILYPESPAYMGSKVKELLSCGVKIIGGCCGTNPEHIRIMKKSIEAFRR